MSTLTVGAGQQFSTIAAAVAAANDGDVLAVQAGTYTNDFANIDTKLTIEGVGGMVNLVATESPSNGKAILTTNTDVTIRNVAFSGAQVPDENGAGIRFQGGNLVIENCLFENNENGLLSGTVPGGTITIRDSEFANNGRGDGYTHNLYAGEIAKLTVENSHFHGAVIGHEVKSRALETVITGSRIEQGADGTGSYSIDLPNGGKVTISDNYIQQGANSDNPVMIHFGGEGAVHDGSSLTVTGNTVVNDMVSPSAALVVNETGVTAYVANEAVYGLTSDQIVSGLADISDITTLLTHPASDLISDLLDDVAELPASVPVSDTPVVVTEPVSGTDVTVDTPASEVPVVVDTPASDTPVVVTEPVSDTDVAVNTPASGAEVVVEAPVSDTDVAVETPAFPAPAVDNVAEQVSEDPWQGGERFTFSVNGQAVEVWRGKASLAADQHDEVVIPNLAPVDEAASVLSMDGQEHADASAALQAPELTSFHFDPWG
ncbi:MAG TPA: right-handed parallel beta-helix repeat-containing protein [Roseomonas sp.]